MNLYEEIAALRLLLETEKRDCQWAKRSLKDKEEEVSVLHSLLIDAFKEKGQAVQERDFYSSRARKIQLRYEALVQRYLAEKEKREILERSLANMAEDYRKRIIEGQDILADKTVNHYQKTKTRILMGECRGALQELLQVQRRYSNMPSFSEPDWGIWRKISKMAKRQGSKNPPSNHSDS